MTEPNTYTDTEGREASPLRMTSGQRYRYTAPGGVTVEFTYDQVNGATDVVVVEEEE